MGTVFDISDPLRSAINRRYQGNAHIERGLCPFGSLVLINALIISYDFQLLHNRGITHLSTSERSELFRLREGGNAAQKAGERDGEHYDEWNGDEQPGEKRLAGEKAQLLQKPHGGMPDQLKWRAREHVQIHSPERRKGNDPAAEPGQRHDKRHLEGHGDVVGGLDGGQVEPEEQRNHGAERRGDADNRDTAENKAECQRERQTPRADAPSQGLRRLSPDGFPVCPEYAHR